MELIAEWKNLEQKFAHSAAVAYKAIWETLRERFGDVGITESFRLLEEMATSQSSDTLWEIKWGKKLMTQLAAECKAVGAKWAVIEWFMQKSLLALLRLHTHGLREIKGLNRKIAKELEHMTRPSGGVLDPERTKRVESKLVELSKVMEHQAAILANLDLKVADIGKLNTRMKFAISKVTNASFKVFKSFRFRTKSSGDSGVGLSDTNTDINSNNKEVDNFHEQGDSQTKTDLSPRWENHPRAMVSHNPGDSPSTGDTPNIGDSPKFGGFPKARVIHVKPLHSDDTSDNGELGIQRTDSSESSSSSCRNDTSTLLLLASSPGHSLKGSQTISIQTDELSQKTSSPVSLSPVSLDQSAPKCHVGTPAYNNGDIPLKNTWAEQHLMSDLVPPQTAKPLSEQFEVYVRVVKAYQAQDKNELSLKIGQILKQKTPAYSDGFALGWTKAHRFAFKRTGFYPIHCVELIPNDKEKD